MKWRVLMAPVAALFAATAGAADIHALVIGIDDYERLPTLRGAANDARDLADALQTAGSKSVEVLINQQADRDHIFASWRQMLSRARPGDTLVLTYSGHGGRDPERYPGSGGGDGFDEPLLLGGFTPQTPGNYQRIFDTEVAELVRQAADFNVILLVDACHSGTPTRSINSTVRPSLRWAGDYGPIEDDQLLPRKPPKASPGAIAAPPGNAIVIGGSLDTQLVQELVIDGQYRGPASLLLARALRGAADTDGNRDLSVAELYDYITEGVRSLTEGRQEATVEFVGARSRSLFKTLPPKASPVASLAFAAVPAGSAAAERELMERFSGVIPTPARRARLIWNREQGTVVSDLGDVVGYAKQVDDVQPIIDKWRLLGHLDSLQAVTPLSLRLGGGDRGYKAGESVDIIVQPRGEKLILVNLSPAGIVQLLYPLGAAEANAKLTPGQPFRIPDVTVTADSFGSEHVIAISARTIPPDWLDTLRALNGKPETARLLQKLDGWLRETPGVAMGRVGLYSKP